MLLCVLILIDEKITRQQARDRAFYIEIGHLWYAVKNDDAVKRGDLKKIAPWFKHDPDTLQKCLRISLYRKFPEADEWAVETEFNNLYPSEPSRSINLINHFERAMRRRSTPDPIRLEETGQRDSVTILSGDCRTLLRDLPAASFHVCVTSVPYHGQRDYGGGAQEIGREPLVSDYIAALETVFDEVKRVLRDDGTLYVNVGDRWSSAARTAEKGDPRWSRHALISRPADLLPAKNVLGIPAELRRALQQQGWICRSEIVWVTTTGNSESVEDRPSHVYELILMLVKSPRYHYDLTYQQPAIDRKWTSAKRRRQGGSPVERDTKAFNDVWFIPAESHIPNHPAAFPEALVERCLSLSCPAGGNVLDPFAGSGTVAAVAKRLGMTATVIDLVPAFADQIRQRVAAVTVRKTTEPQEQRVEECDPMTARLLRHAT